jgi:hypothetical protein
MKNISILFISLVFGFTAIAQSVTVDVVVDKYCKAKGETKFAKVQSIQMDGSMVRNDVMPLTYYRTRPNKYMMKYDVADLTAYRVYDGQNAWYTAPWRNINEPTLIPEAQAKDFILLADFDDQLATWKSKGHKLTLMPEEIVSGATQYVIDLEHATSGLISTYYIDKKSYMLTKLKIIRGTGERTVTQETFYSEYKPVDGIMFPHLIDVFTNGNKTSSTEIDEIILNVKLDSDFYSMSR